MKNLKIKHLKKENTPKVAASEFYYDIKFIGNPPEYSKTQLEKNSAQRFMRSVTYHVQGMNTDLYRSYINFEFVSADVFDGWCRHINDADIDLRSEFDPSIIALESFTNNEMSWRHVLFEFMDAIKDYKDQQKELNHISEISKESAKRFLWLAPILANHNPRVYIDSSNGNFNIDIPTHDNGILSSQISENGYIYYSLVGQNTKIYKITGTAKFKTSKDFIKFNKILRML